MKKSQHIRLKNKHCNIQDISYPFKTSFGAAETADMRKLPDYEEKVAKFLPEISQLSLLGMNKCNKNHYRQHYTRYLLTVHVEKAIKH